MLAGALFNIKGSQLCFLTANHIVADLVSWRIILEDPEEFFSFLGNRRREDGAFQLWCDLQAKHSRNQIDLSQGHSL